jgi:hypothetical protein
LENPVLLLPRVATHHEVISTASTTHAADTFWSTLIKQLVQISECSINVVLRPEGHRMSLLFSRPEIMHV